MSSNADERALRGRIALVAGATRGAGRGIATALGEAGATVYCTGRSTRARPKPVAPPGATPFELAYRAETIEDTAERVDAVGGHGVPVAVDHTDEAQVRALMARIEAEHGRLDIVVDDIWGGDALAQWGVPTAQTDFARGRALFETGFWTHVITSRLVLPLLAQSDRGLLIEVTDGDSMAWRGSFFYDPPELVTRRSRSARHSRSE